MLSPDQQYMIEEIAKAVDRHMRQDEAELNSELQMRSYRALVTVRLSKLVDDEDFKALCFAAGISYYEIDKQIQAMNAALRG